MNLEYPRARAAARRLLGEYGIGRPEDIDVEALAAAKNVVVLNAPLGGSQARLLRMRRAAVIRVDSGLASAGQRRFCIAHELGHFDLHPAVDQLALCLSVDMLPGYQRRPEEPEANAYAAELLLPEFMFRRAAKQRSLNLALVEDLAEQFRTTLLATVLRVVELGVAVCALVRSERGMIRWSRASPEFRFRLPEWGSRLNGATCAAEFFRTGRTDKVEDDVPVDAWLLNDELDAQWHIRELMVPMPAYNSALSILGVVPGSPLDDYEPEDASGPT